MKKLRNVFTKIKDINDEYMLNNEKVTIMNRSKVMIQNYDKIIEINDEVIRLSKLKILGQNLKLKTISKYFLEITGKINLIDFGDQYEK